MNKETNDFLVDIIQDFNEIQSILKVLKDSLNNENNEIVFKDVANSLEIVISKMHNTNLSLDKFAESLV
jgi:hypothetical protein